MAREIEIERNAAVPTWFGVGGRADRLARPGTVDDVRRCLDLDPDLVVLGDGANLLVDDDGIGRLVLATTAPGMTGVAWGEDGRVVAGAGANLPRLITEAVRRGLGGVEGLGGIPATLGGAVVMNAGGKFGQIADVVERIHGVDRAGRALTLERAEIAFGYRRSGLNGLIVTGVELRLVPGDAAALRQRLKEVMAYKSASQPMGERCAGCAYKNPEVPASVAARLGVEATEAAGLVRISAGLILDRAGCKGMAVGGATISERHANFFYVRPGARARDVIELMDAAEKRVMDTFGVRLEREVVIWRRG